MEDSKFFNGNSLIRKFWQLSCQRSGKFLVRKLQEVSFPRSGKCLIGDFKAFLVHEVENIQFLKKQHIMSMKWKKFI